MKKTLALLIALLLILPLAACSNSSEGSETVIDDNNSQTETKTAEVTEVETDIPQTGSEVYDVGDFTVYVPAGWAAIPQIDYNNPEQTATNDIQLCKGAEYDEELKAWKIANKPTVTVFESTDIDKIPGTKSMWGDETEDLEEVQIGMYTWQGFSYEYLGSDGVVIWTINGDYGYNINARFNYELNLDDADVRAIIESLA